MRVWSDIEKHIGAPADCRQHHSHQFRIVPGMVLFGKKLFLWVSFKFLFLWVSFKFLNFQYFCGCPLNFSFKFFL